MPVVRVMSTPYILPTLFLHYFATLSFALLFAFSLQAIFQRDEHLQTLEPSLRPLCLSFSLATSCIAASITSSIFHLCILFFRRLLPVFHRLHPALSLLAPCFIAACILHSRRLYPVFSPLVSCILATCILYSRRLYPVFSLVSSFPSVANVCNKSTDFV